MTPHEAACKINGGQYGMEVSNRMSIELKDAGLVAVFGASDDLMEFRGAIYDEVGCYSGGVAYLTPAGLLNAECDNEECPHEKRLKERATTIEALWDDGGFSWRYKTSIPHATFVIKEDDDDYCEGIVFALTDVPAL